MFFHAASYASETIYFFHNDHLVTPQEITDINQNIVWEVGDDPFSADRPLVELVNNNIRFPGQYYDEETGLHYNWNRYYDPQTGRYITSYLIGLVGGLNTYGYAYQNPILRSDPTGLVPPNDYYSLETRFHPENIAANAPPLITFFSIFGSNDLRTQNLNPATERSYNDVFARQELTDMDNYNFGLAAAANGWGKYPL